MKSKVTIGVDYDNAPVIKIEHVASEDVRDTLVGRFVDAFGAQSSWAKFRMVEFHPANPGEPQKTGCVLRPLLPVDMRGHASLMSSWANHLERSLGVEMSSDDTINAQAAPGGIGISGEMPAVRQFTKGLIIETGGDHYKCICADDEVAVFGRITKWNDQECRVNFELTFVYSQNRWSNADYRIISPLVPVDIG